MYLIFWASIDPYMLTGDVSRSYMWSTVDFCVEDIPRDIIEVWISYLYIGEQGCSQFL
jgi:hypothetical protein